MNSRYLFSLSSSVLNDKMHVCVRCSNEIKQKRQSLMIVFFCGATRTLFSLFYLITKIKRNKEYAET